MCACIHVKMVAKIEQTQICIHMFCMYGCIYVCVCVCVSVCIHIVCMYACIHVCMHACMHACAYIQQNPCVYVAHIYVNVCGKFAA
jgi:hypothetical protein